VVLPKENHMQLIEAATLDRKSGGAEGSVVSLQVATDLFLPPTSPTLNPSHDNGLPHPCVHTLDAAV
jgi:hypothetical protein